MKKKVTLILTVASFSAAVLIAAGCKDKTTPTTPEQPQTSAKSATPASAEIEQTVCPVMGGPVNEAIFVEYEGKKVYFCCAPCKEKFQNAPQEYLAKLPQFKTD